MVFTVDRATRSTLRQSVADRLRAAIADGRIAAGVHLAEIELSETLAVSRATLREALRQLQQEGLLTQDTRGRVSVRRVEPDEVHDLFEVRSGLEATAAQRLCLLHDRSEVTAALRATLEPLRTSRTLQEALDADVEFHETLCLLTGNATLHRTWVGLSGVIRITMVAAGPDPARANAAYERHAPIVDLIADGDGAGVREFLAEHMSSAADLLVARLRASRSAQG